MIQSLNSVSLLTFDAISQKRKEKKKKEKKKEKQQNK